MLILKCLFLCCPKHATYLLHLYFTHNYKRNILQLDARKAFYPIPCQRTVTSVRIPIQLTHWWLVLYMFLQLPLPLHSWQPLTHCHNSREDLRVAKGKVTPSSCTLSNSHILSNSHRWPSLESYSVLWCFPQYLDMPPLVLGPRKRCFKLPKYIWILYIPVTTYTVNNLISSFTKLHGFSYTICMKWPKVTAVISGQWENL